MTKTMLERAARAAAAEMQKVEMIDAAPSVIAALQSRRVARAVLMAVREPGLEVRGVCRFSTAETEWPALIDAILNEPQP